MDNTLKINNNIYSNNNNKLLEVVNQLQNIVNNNNSEINNIINQIKNIKVY